MRTTCLIFSAGNLLGKPRPSALNPWSLRYSSVRLYGDLDRSSFLTPDDLGGCCGGVSRGLWVEVEGAGGGSGRAPEVHEAGSCFLFEGLDCLLLSFGVGAYCLLGGEFFLEDLAAGEEGLLPSLSVTDGLLGGDSSSEVLWQGKGAAF